MSEKVFFSKHFTGMDINFTKPHPSTWTLGEKLSERNDQSNEAGFRKYGGPYAAWAIFVCSRNIDDHSETALMKIFMQYGSPVFFANSNKAWFS